MEPTGEKHLRAMTFLVTLGGIFVLGGTAEAGQDSYLSALLALPAVLAVGALYAQLVRLGDTDGYFDLCRRSCGSVGGAAVIAVTGVYALLVGSALLGDLTYFVHTVMLPALPKSMIAAAVLLAAAYASAAGDRALRWSAPLFTHTILGMLAFTVLLSLLAVDYGNFPLPVFSGGIRPILNGSWTVFTMSFCDAALLLPLVRGRREDKRRRNGFLCGGIAAGLLLVLIFLRNLLALGNETAARLFFRSFAAVRVVSFGAFFQRLEIFVSLAYLLCDLFELTVCIRCAASSVGAIMKRPLHKAAVLPILLILFAAALLFTADEQGITAMIRIGRPAAAITAVLLPLTVWICTVRKEKRVGKT